jgi:hypothetical protein
VATGRTTSIGAASDRRGSRSFDLIASTSNV